MSVLQSSELCQKKKSQLLWTQSVKKCCDLDPIPASIPNKCKSVLLSFLINMVNMSLQSSCTEASNDQTEAQEGQLGLRQLF